AGVLGHQDVRGVAGEPCTEAREPGAEAGAEQERGGADRPAAADDDPGADAVVARRPLGGEPLLARHLLADPDDDGAFLDAERLGAGDDLDALALGVGELDAVRALFGGVGAPEVAERAAPAPLHVDWELIRAVPRLLAPLDEEPVVLVDPLGREEVDVVLLHVLARAGGDVGVVEAGDVPAADHALR